MEIVLDQNGMQGKAQLRSEADLRILERSKERLSKFGDRLSCVKRMMMLKA